MFLFLYLHSPGHLLQGALLPAWGCWRALLTLVGPLPREVVPSLGRKRLGARLTSWWVPELLGEIQRNG